MKNIRATILILGAMFMLAMQARATMYFGRPYDPNLQRWIQRDPIGEAGGVNLFQFVGNNPLRYVDPLGLDYWTVYVTGFSGAAHQVVYGDDGSGGSYTIEYGPQGGGLNRLYGPGQYNYNHYNYPPNQLAYNPKDSQRRQTCPEVDKSLNGTAAGLGANNGTPNYCVLGNNCWTTAPKFDNIANNYQNFGTPYSPINTQQNLPPLIITR